MCRFPVMGWLNCITDQELEGGKEWKRKLSDRKAAGNRIREKRRQLGITMKKRRKSWKSTDLIEWISNGAARNVGGNHDCHIPALPYVSGLLDPRSRRRGKDRSRRKDIPGRNRGCIPASEPCVEERKDFYWPRSSGGPY